MSGRSKLTLTEAAKLFGWKENAVILLMDDIDSWGPALPIHEFLEESPNDVWEMQRRETEQRLEYPEKQQAAWRDRRDAHFHTEMMRLAQTITLGDLFEQMEKNYRERKGSYWFCKEHQATTRRLEKAGFTRIDCVALSKRTVTIEMLRKLSREQLLSLDAAIVLGGRYSDYYPKSWGRPANQPLTVADFLNNNWIGTRSWPILRELGFGPEDAPKLADENDPCELLAKQLVAEENVALEDARKIAAIAIKRKWS